MLTPEDLQLVREVVRTENLLLTDAVADVLGSFFKAQSMRLTEIEQSLGLLITGQAYVERLCAHLSDRSPENDADEPWRASLKDNA